MVASTAAAAPSSVDRDTVTASTATTATTTSRTGNNGSVLKLWGPQYMETNKVTTLAEATQDAREFDVITAKPKFYIGYTDAMRQANPNLVMTGYLNASMSNTNTLPKDWYNYAADGSFVRSQYQLYLMDIRKPEWVQNRIDLCQSIVAAAKYDGCILDILGPGPVIGPFPSGQADKPPIDVRTGQPWTVDEWMRSTISITQQIHNALPHLQIDGNGTGNGLKYFNPSMGATWRLSEVAPRMAVEGFVRIGRAPIEQAYSEPDWKADIDMVTDAESKGYELMLITKVWADGTAARKAQWHEFSLGSYLLAANGRTRWIFSANEARMMDWNPWWDKAEQLGAPTTTYRKNARGVYIRKFTNGRVLVNPGETTITQGLGGATFRRLDDTLVTRVTLPPKSAAVLRTP